MIVTTKGQDFFFYQSPDRGCYEGSHHGVSSVHSQLPFPPVAGILPPPGTHAAQRHSIEQTRITELKIHFNMYFLMYEWGWPYFFFFSTFSLLMLFLCIYKKNSSPTRNYMSHIMSCHCCKYFCQLTYGSKYDFLVTLMYPLFSLGCTCVLFGLFFLWGGIYMCFITFIPSKSLAKSHHDRIIYISFYKK